MELSGQEKDITYSDIYECIKGDDDFLKYFHPFSRAKNNEEAAMETFDVMKGHEQMKKCYFVVTEIGYIFYAKKELISFCIKPEHRNKRTFKLFWSLIKNSIGKHFYCYLYSNNTRAIKFLIKAGMKTKKADKLLTLLNI